MAAYWALGSWRVGPVGMPSRLFRAERQRECQWSAKGFSKMFWFY